MWSFIPTTCITVVTSARIIALARPHLHASAELLLVRDRVVGVAELGNALQGPRSDAGFVCTERLQVYFG